MPSGRKSPSFCEGCAPGARVDSSFRWNDNFKLSLLQIIDTVVEQHLAGNVLFQDFDGRIPVDFAVGYPSAGLPP
jgi:hypothetical protein